MSHGPCGMDKIYFIWKTFMRCIDGDLLNTGKFIFAMKEKKTFAEAENFCIERGLQLPMPASIAENDEPRFQNRKLISFERSI